MNLKIKFKVPFNVLHISYKITGGKGAQKAKAPPPAKGKGLEKNQKKGSEAILDEREITKVKRTLPKSKEHIMVELKAFLNHLESDRVLYEELQLKPWVRTDEENEKVRENSCMSVEDGISLLEKCNNSRNRLKEIRQSFYQGLYSEYEQKRNNCKQTWDGSYKNRENQR